MRYLVRHADAGDKRAWTGPDGDRPLSKTGHLQVEGLIAELAVYPIAQIVSSPAARCWQTVRPLAEQRRLPVRIDAALSVDADLDEAVALLLRPRPDDVLLCTHGELIGPLLGRLRDLGAPLGGELAWPKASIWLLEAADGAVTGARYLPPRQLDGSG